MIETTYTCDRCAFTSTEPMYEVVDQEPSVLPIHDPLRIFKVKYHLCKVCKPKWLNLQDAIENHRKNEVMLFMGELKAGDSIPAGAKRSSK